MSMKYYVLSAKEHRRKVLLKEYLERIDKELPLFLLEMAPIELSHHIEDVELDDAAQNTSRLLVSAMETRLEGNQEQELCEIAGAAYLRRFNPIQVFDDTIIVEDEYGKVYSLNEFETHMKESYPKVSAVEIEGMVRMMKRWEERM